jgi:hypothetical protein
MAVREGRITYLSVILPHLPAGTEEMYIYKKGLNLESKWKHVMLKVRYYAVTLTQCLLRLSAYLRPSTVFKYTAIVCGRMEL